MGLFFEKHERHAISNFMICDPEHPKLRLTQLMLNLFNTIAFENPALVFF